MVGGLRRVLTVGVAMVCGVSAASGERFSYDIAPGQVAETVGADVKRYLELRTKDASFTIGGVAPKTIHVGETAFAVSNGLSCAQFKDEEWVIRSIGGDLVLNGKGRGLTFAMVHFLDDECGIRWWSEYEEFVPTGDLALGPLDRRGRPAFARRHIGTTPKGRKDAARFAAYSLLNDNGGKDERYGPIKRYGTGGGCHTFRKYLPPDKHFKTHPEWFSMDAKSGRRTMAQVCLTHPEVRAEFKRQLRVNIEKDRALCATTGEPPPEKFRGREIVDFTAVSMKVPKNSQIGKMVPDRSTPVNFAIKLPWDETRSKRLDLPFCAGVRDNLGKRELVSAKFDRPLGEGWHWYHIGRAVPTADTYIWVSRNSGVHVNGRRYCEIWDREWDFWVSVKFTGPKYGMPPKDGKSSIWIDRVVLVAPDRKQ